MTNLTHLIVGVDGSGGSRRALEWAAAQEPCTRLTIAHGFSPARELLASAFQLNLDPLRADHEHLLATAWSEPARSAAAEVETVLVDDNPADALVQLAATRGAQAIVVGHHGHSRWSEHHVGNVAGKLLHKCDVPLIITNDQTKPEPLEGTIVVGLSRPTTTDNPELDWALDLAHAVGAQVHLVSLVEPVAYIDADHYVDMARIHKDMRSQMDALVERLRPEHRSIGVSSEVRDGPALEQLAAVASEAKASMVVIGSHQPGRIAGFVAGSVARLLPSQLPCPMAAIARV